LDPRFKNRLSSDRTVFCAQITSWLKEDTDEEVELEKNEVENFELPSKKKAHTSFFDVLGYATSSTQKSLNF
jgi:hypothetical protein